MCRYSCRDIELAGVDLAKKWKFYGCTLFVATVRAARKSARPHLRTHTHTPWQRERDGKEAVVLAVGPFSVMCVALPSKGSVRSDAPAASARGVSDPRAGLLRQLALPPVTLDLPYVKLVGVNVEEIRDQVRADERVVRGEGMLTIVTSGAVSHHFFMDFEHAKEAGDLFGKYTQKLAEKEGGS